MTSPHADCTHPKTKSARARCRKLQAEIARIRAEHEAENQRYHEVYIRPFEEQEAKRKEWETESEKFSKAHQASASQNADDTSLEENFSTGSYRWYETAISTLHCARDNAPQNLDLDLLEEGESLDFVAEGYVWVDYLGYPNDGHYAILVDREGNRTKWMLDDLKRLKAQREAYTQYISDGLADTDGWYCPIDFEAFCATLGKDI